MQPITWSETPRQQAASRRAVSTRQALPILFLKRHKIVNVCHYLPQHPCAPVSLFVPDYHTPYSDLLWRFLLFYPVDLSAFGEQVSVYLRLIRVTPLT